VTRSPTTSWTLLEGVLRGDAASNARFVGFYFPVVLAYLQGRWRKRALVQDAEDAAHEVLVDFLREGGALERCDAESPLSFRTYLLGVTRKVALRCEERERLRHERNGALDSYDLAPDESQVDPALLFDRRWALGILGEALGRMRSAAADGDGGVARELALLHERFFDGRSIATIAAERGEDAARLHHEYARARRTFEAALIDTLRDHARGDRAIAPEDLADLLGLL
jgi:hypothetical protein